MFNQDIAINELLVSIESVLLLEYRADQKVEDTLAAAIERLENTHALRLDRDVFTIMHESELMFNNLSVFMRNLKTALSALSFYTDLKLFHKDLPITLSSVNYLGMDRQELLNALRNLQDTSQYAKHANDIMPPIANALDQIPLCTVKRMLCIILLLHRLGVSEGVSVMARLLYIGGLKP